MRDRYPNRCNLPRLVMRPTSVVRWESTPNAFSGSGLEEAIFENPNGWSVKYGTNVITNVSSDIMGNATKAAAKLIEETAYSGRYFERS